MTASESPCSLFLVEHVRPRWDLTVTDVMTGRTFRVIDPEVSTLIRPDEILVSAVLTLDGVSTLLGTGNCALPLGVQRKAADICDAYHGQRWMSRAELLGHDVPERAQLRVDAPRLQEVAHRDGQADQLGEAPLLGQHAGEVDRHQDVLEVEPLPQQPLGAAAEDVLGL